SLEPAQGQGRLRQRHRQRAPASPQAHVRRGHAVRQEGLSGRRRVPGLAQQVRQRPHQGRGLLRESGLRRSGHPPVGRAQMAAPDERTDGKIVIVPRLELRHVSKRFGSVVANHDVDLVVDPGEIHAVLGENGAGKSTLMKIVYGALQPDKGELRWDGQPVRLRSPHQARELGVAMVFQHFSLFETLTVAENVWLGQQRTVALEAVRADIRRKAEEYSLELDPDRPVHVLSVGERQRGEIVRALLTEPRLLILDEPTSVLTPKAVEKLFATLRKLAQTGCSILYISHKLDEILALCRRCTVLRGGRVTGACDLAQQSAAGL